MSNDKYVTVACQLSRVFRRNAKWKNQKKIKCESLFEEPNGARWGTSPKEVKLNSERQAVERVQFIFFGFQVQTFYSQAWPDFFNDNQRRPACEDACVLFGVFLVIFYNFFAVQCHRQPNKVVFLTKIIWNSIFVCNSAVENSMNYLYFRSRSCCFES